MDTIKPNEPCFFTQQVFLIGTYNEDDSPHFAPISWISWTCGEPACLVITMGGNKRTKRNIKRTSLLSAAVLTPDLLPFAERCNSRAKNDMLNWSDRPSFERGKALCVPIISGAKWTYECEVIHTVELGGAHTYFAAIKQINVAPEIQSLDFIDLRIINPVIYAHYHYFSVGEHLGEIGDYSKGR
ncbi:MAG: flavin reductase [Oscillospiraceae bacterium]|jgi:flavin reductase (DIM6/NTAB) family NADH-FMN oxidoreductase RutF|nr:flavin reductase [Oscillospiraceae bacterium]